MTSVLINAYACSPHWGSEPGMAWNWIVALSRYCEIYVITEGEWRENIELALRELPTSERIHFFYLPVKPYIRRMCWNQGNWLFYYYYRKWQQRAYRLACQIVSTHKIELVHQLNMIGFREPGYLWKIEGIPFVWGPIGGLNLFPESYLVAVEWSQSLKIKLKNIINRFQMRYAHRVRKAVNHANALISATPETVSWLSNVFHRDSYLISETGCSSSSFMPQKERETCSDYLELLWVGRFFYAKQLNIALETVSLLKGLPVRLHIVGDGTDKEIDHYKAMAHSLLIDDMCIWYGQIPHNQVFNLMYSSHLLFFTSVSEATSSVVFEAMQCGLPVLCFNTCGFGAVVNDRIGLKIELSEPRVSARAFAEVIKSICDNRQLLEQLSANCYKELEQYSWDEKAKRVVSIYNHILEVHG